MVRGHPFSLCLEVLLVLGPVVALGVCKPAFSPGLEVAPGAIEGVVDVPWAAHC